MQRRKQKTTQRYANPSATDVELFGPAAHEVGGVELGLELGNESPFEDNKKYRNTMVCSRTR